MVKNYTINEIETVARQVWEYGKGYKVWAFYAPMGAGKTTFIHSICDILQVQEAVGSPTFALINEYSSEEAGTIYHMDWYRLKDEQEANNAGMEDAILSGNYCFIEWPEKAEGILPGDRLNIHIGLVDRTTRHMVVSHGSHILKKD